jgi:hypothetical protein
VGGHASSPCDLSRTNHNTSSSLSLDIARSAGPPPEPCVFPGRDDTLNPSLVVRMSKPFLSKGSAYMIARQDWRTYHLRPSLIRPPASRASLFRCRPHHASLYTDPVLVMKMPVSSGQWTYATYSRRTRWPDIGRRKCLYSHWRLYSSH